MNATVYLVRCQCPNGHPQTTAVVYCPEQSGSEEEALQFHRASIDEAVMETMAHIAESLRTGPSYLTCPCGQPVGRWHLLVHRTPFQTADLGYRAAELDGHVLSLCADAMRN